MNPPSNIINNLLFRSRLNQILKVSYKSMTLEEIQKLILDTEAFLQKTLQFFKNEEIEFKLNSTKKERYDQLIGQRKLIKENAYYRLGNIRKYFANKEYPPLTDYDKSQLDEIDKSIESLEYDVYRTDIKSISKDKDDCILSIQKRIDRLKAEIPKKEHAAVKKARMEGQKAIIDTHKKKTRRIDDKIKKALKEQLINFPNCPYCNVFIGRKPHIDHIYPISHGGLSAIYNMVYICSSCNLYKKDFTLREFIDKNGLNRDEVENNLLKMGKRF